MVGSHCWSEQWRPVTALASLPSIFRPRSVFGYRARKGFTHHWNIDVICRKINDIIRILISLTSNASRGNPKGMIVRTLRLNSNQTFDGWAIFQHHMTKRSGSRSERDHLFQDCLPAPPKRLKGYTFFWPLVQTTSRYSFANNKAVPVQPLDLTASWQCSLWKML